jgi:hypothetical protein
MTKAPNKEKGLLDEMTDFFFGDPASAQDFEGKMTKCFLCGRWADVRLSKKQRPYFVCDPCGVQVFVRGTKGIERLKSIVRDREDW